jgi:iron(III) transport system substrate-binding protein
MFRKAVRGAWCVVLLVGCSRDHRTPLVVYSPHGRDLLTLFERRFEALHPDIDVRWLDMGSQDVYDRLRSERANPQADVWFGGPSLVLAQAAHDSLLDCRRPVWADAIPPRARGDGDCYFAAYETPAVFLYAEKVVPDAAAPQDWDDLLDPKWKGKIIKAHPGYSGTIMTATYQVSRDLGWEFFEKLAQQNILQVQSAADPPKKLALGERAIQADGVEYLIFQEKEKGQPVEPVYASEGTPIIIGPNGLFKAAPNPNAARLFQSFCFSPECQKLAVEIGGLRSVHPQVPEHQGRTPLGKIKLMKDDAAAVLKNGEQIKARYVKIFRV